MSDLDRLPVAGGDITLGDHVRVAPSRPGRRDGFTGTVRRIYQYDNPVSENRGDIDVTVWGGPNGHASMRTVHHTRIRKIKLHAIRADP